MTVNRPVETDPPTLTLAGQTLNAGQSLSYTIPAAGNLEPWETATIAVTTAGFSYDEGTTAIVSSGVLTSVGDSTVDGTIEDDLGNSSNWAFALSVTRPVETDAPTLAIPDQTVDAGQPLNYALPDGAIAGLDPWERVTITVTTAGIVYNPANRILRSAAFTALGTTTVEGTIKDDLDNSSNWSFDIVVVRPASDNIAPSLG